MPLDTYFARSTQTPVQTVPRGIAYQPGPETAPPPSSPLSTGLCALADGLCLHREALGKLASRLEPVLTPAAPSETATTGPITIGRSPTTACVASHAESVSRATAIIEDILRRLEV